MQMTISDHMIKFIGYNETDQQWMATIHGVGHADSDFKGTKGGSFNHFMGELKNHIVAIEREQRDKQ